jgi:quercetin dioxygenase-like cupin family protein
VEYLRKVNWDTLGDKAQFLFDRTTGATTCKIVISKRGPGSQSPRGVHTHPFDQILYILSGHLWVEISGQEFIVEPGTLVVQPAGEPHRNWNPPDNDEPAIFLEVMAPMPALGETREGAGSTFDREAGQWTT